MNKVEIKEIRNSKKEIMHSLQHSDKSQRKIRQIYRLLYDLKIDQPTLTRLKDDIITGEIFNKFHLYNELKISDIHTIYDFYKELK